MKRYFVITLACAILFMGVVCAQTDVGPETALFAFEPTLKSYTILLDAVNVAAKELLFNPKMNDLRVRSQDVLTTAKNKLNTMQENYADLKNTYIQKPGDTIYAYRLKQLQTLLKIVPAQKGTVNIGALDAWFAEQQRVIADLGRILAAPGATAPAALGKPALVEKNKEADLRELQKTNANLKKEFAIAQAQARVQPLRHDYDTGAMPDAIKQYRKAYNNIIGARDARAQIEIEREYLALVDKQVEKQRTNYEKLKKAVLDYENELGKEYTATLKTAPALEEENRQLMMAIGQQNKVGIYNTALNDALIRDFEMFDNYFGTWHKLITSLFNMEKSAGDIAALKKTQKKYIDDLDKKYKSDFDRAQKRRLEAQGIKAK